MRKVYCTHHDVEVIDVNIFWVYWLCAHQVTLRFISCVRKVNIFGFIGYVRTR